MSIPPGTTPQTTSGASPAAHTPGPWHYFGRPSRMWHIHTSAPMRLMRFRAICFTHQRQTEAGLRESEANARLIAASPVLLEALQEAASWFDAYADEHLAKGSAEKALRNKTRANILRTAIAKALGPSAQDTTEPLSRSGRNS
jgi:hypothetical protein